MNHCTENFEKKEKEREREREREEKRENLKYKILAASFPLVINKNFSLLYI